jgi:hypothetical protein
MPSRIINPNHGLISVHIGAVETAINSHFDTKNELKIAAGGRPRLADQAKMKMQMMLIVTQVITPRIAESFRLHLDDLAVTEELNISARRAKQLRLELQDAGIVWFPEWSRPKRPGHRPYWMLVQSFIKWPEVEMKAKTAKTSKTYNQTYCVMFEAACKKAYAQLVRDDRYIMIREFMPMVYGILNADLATAGITKESLKK